MKKNRKNCLRTCYAIFFLVFLLMACSGQKENGNEPVPDAGFPYKQQWTYPANKKIWAVSGNNDIVALATDEKIVAISSINGGLLWEFPFKVDITVTCLLTEKGVVVATNREEMIVIDAKTGQLLWEINATSKFGGGFQVDSVSENYVIVERTASWTLEVYDIKTGKMFWETFGSRGGSGVYADEGFNLLILVGGQHSPRIFDLKTGELLSQQDRYTTESFVYEFPFVYYVRNEEKEIAVTIGGLDLHTMEEQWAFYAGDKIYQLMLAGDKLVVSGENGLYVLSKNGDLLWKADAHNLGEGINDKAVGIGENIFATVRNTGKIYAWLPDGQQVGALSFPGKGGLKQIFGTGVRIASGGDLLLVISDDALYAYGK